MSGRGENHAGQALRRRFEAEERQAIDAVARWIGHPALRSIVERRRIGAETVVMPIAHLLTSQSEVIRFCWHVYGMTGIEPGWVLRQGKPWLLTVSQMNAIERVKADFRGVVQLAVNEMEGAGVPLVPSWDGDHVVSENSFSLTSTGISRRGSWPKICSRRRSARSISMPPARSTGAAAGNGLATT